VSAVAGCCWFDGRPASIDDLRPSTDAALHRSKEPFRFRCSGSTGLAYAADRPNSCQPFHDPASRTTLIVDGPIDNLDELAGVLDAPDRSAAAVALAAWHRWGVDAGSHLLGDFVIVIWAEPARRLVCMRAPLGQRPLFYGKGSRGVVLGSEMQQVVRHPAIRAEINEAMVAEYLTAEPATVGDTLWRGVHRLPPAHALEITNGSLSVKRFWDFDPSARVRYPRESEYAEHFHDVFTRAVECCVRDVERVGVFLSGGIDSSAVAGVAQTIGAARGRPPVHAFTMAFPGRPCDETDYSQAVADKWGLNLTRADASALSRDTLARAPARSLDVPPFPNSLVVVPLRDLAAAAGVGVLLTGFGGDDFFTGDASRVELLKQGRVIAWGRSMVSPLLSDRARDLLRPVFGARRCRPWIAPALVSRTALDDRLRRQSPLPFPTWEQQEIHRSLNSLVQILGDEMEDRAANAAGTPQRHPFYDRRIAEFALGLPTSQRSRGDEIKIVLRRALAGYFPPLVASRVSISHKAEFSSTYVEALEAVGGRQAFARLRSEDAGWVDGRVVRQMYEDMIRLYSHGGDAYIAFTGPLWAVASLEFWLDGVSSDRGCASAANAR
jgi:asparagine synthase (glutamine-hydrolysing)